MKSTVKSILEILSGNIPEGELKDGKWNCIIYRWWCILALEELNETSVGFADKITGGRKLTVWQSFKEITVNIDIVKTKEYYNSLSSDMLCDCDYCKLYYAKSRKEFSELALWLDKYGVDIEKPFEVMSLEPDDNGMLDYIGVQYIVFGNFKNDNSYYIGDFNIKIADSHPDTGISDEHFVLEVIPMNSMKLFIKG